MKFIGVSELSYRAAYFSSYFSFSSFTEYRLMTDEQTKVNGKCIMQGVGRQRLRSWNIALGNSPSPKNYHRGHLPPYLNPASCKP